jgi:type II secretory pathway component PulK
VTIRTQIVDENRYFDINNLSVPEQTMIRPAADILKDVMVLCGDVNPGERIDTLRDWVDENDEGRHEAIDVDTAGDHPAPANRVLLGWSELIRIEGFGRDMFRSREDLGIQEPAYGDLIDAVTVLPAARDTVIPINLNTAGHDSLYGVLGIENDQLLEQILTRREQGPIRPEDAAQFSVDPDLIQQLGPYLTVGSAFFRIQSTAVLGSHAETVRALVHRDRDGKVAILHWVL